MKNKLIAIACIFCLSTNISNAQVEKVAEYIDYWDKEKQIIKSVSTHNFNKQKKESNETSIYYDKNGKDTIFLETKINYKLNGLKIWLDTTLEGYVIKNIEHYKNEALNGVAKQYIYPENKLIVEYVYVNDYPSGIKNKYYINGVKSGEYKLYKGNYDGIFKEWHINGELMTEGLYKKGKLIALYKHLDSSGVNLLINGKGIYVDYNPFYIKQSEFQVADNSFNGVAREYYPTGEILSEQNLRYGFTEGIEFIYYRNGNKMSKETYKNGILNGECIYYHENGNKKEEANLKNGKLEGLYSFYNEKGEKYKEDQYTKGRFLSTILYNLKSQRISEKIIYRGKHQSIRKQISYYNLSESIRVERVDRYGLLKIHTNYFYYDNNDKLIKIIRQGAPNNEQTLFEDGIKNGTLKSK